MPKLTIDGREVEVPAGLTVLQACELAGVEIPRFCYHERLSVAGNCRMCLVEQEKAPKPIASCAMPVAEGMVIKTDTPAVKKARNGVMEFLLINHPLDCPICDQGGECDLQDQAVAYGYDRSRYQENKRAVPDKYMGPLIKTIMTRCIQCTRCVRFAAEVAGVEEVGLMNRGEHAEISTLERAVASELSGNLVDICPVGALTARPYAFTARPWELRKTNSVDVLDAVGSNIRIDARGREVMRVLPRVNEAVNEEWLSDKGRYACDGLIRRRLDKPWIRGADGKLQPASWKDAFAAIKAKVDSVQGHEIAALAGDLCDAESMLALKQLMTVLGSPNLDCRQDGSALGNGPEAGFLFNSGIAGIDDADAILLVGTNPRWEAPIINARIRKRFLRGGCKLAMIGPRPDLTVPYQYLGAGAETLQEVAEGRHAFAEVLKAAQKPMVIVGQGALARSDGAAVLALAHKLGEAVQRDGWNGFNVLHTAAARVGGLLLGFLPGATADGRGGRDRDAILAGCESGEIKVVYLLGADELPMQRLGRAFVVYQGHHGDAGAARADVVLPGAAYTEKNGTYVNTEGRVQLGRLAAFPPGEAREDWTIIRALSGELGRPLPYDNLGQLRAHLIEANRRFARLDALTPAAWGSFGKAGSVSNEPFRSPIENYWMTDPISRASPTMAECVATFLPQAAATGTAG